MKKIILAFNFLTIIPVMEPGQIPDEDVGRSTAFFPLVGAAEGLCLAISASLLLHVLPGEVVNALLVMIMIIVNGGLHVDGLADTVDAVASRTGMDRKLEIMKDSSTGAIGVAGVVIDLLLRYVLLNAVSFLAERALYMSVIIMMSVVARWAMVSAILYGRSARKDGLKPVARRPARS